MHDGDGVIPTAPNGRPSARPIADGPKGRERTRTALSYRIAKCGVRVAEVACQPTTNSAGRSSATSSNESADRHFARTTRCHTTMSPARRCRPCERSRPRSSRWESHGSDRRCEPSRPAVSTTANARSHTACPFHSPASPTGDPGHWNADRQNASDQNVRGGTHPRGRDRRSASRLPRQTSGHIHHNRQAHHPGGPNHPPTHTDTTVPRSTRGTASTRVAVSEPGRPCGFQREQRPARSWRRVNRSVVGTILSQIPG